MHKNTLTNQTQPNKAQPDDGENGQPNPARRRNVQCQPKEALVGGIDLPRLGLGRLKHPVAVAGRGIDLVPPA